MKVLYWQSSQEMKKNTKNSRQPDGNWSRNLFKSEFVTTTRIFSAKVDHDSFKMFIDIVVKLLHVGYQI
jgi:hypothetical protein